MSEPNPSDGLFSFLGTGWAFPPEFTGAGARMVTDEDDIQQSLEILLGTAAGERFLRPKYGLSLRDQLFEPMSTSMVNLVLDRVRTAILIYEPRIKVLRLRLDQSRASEGCLELDLDYEVRSTNSRFNLVYPFNLTESREWASGR